MKYLKTLGITSLIVIITTLLLMLLITLLNYTDITNTKITNILKIITPLLSISIGGFILGKKANKNGYLEGIKLGIIFVFLLLILNLIFFNISLKDIIFYTLIIISSTIGSMAGINTKEEK